MKKKFLIILLTFNMLLGFAQQLTWTGNAGNNDFFDEANWKDNVSNLPPSLNTINPNQTINLDLFIITTSNKIIANGIINLGTGSLYLTSTNIVADAVSGGSIEINNEAYLDLNSNTPFQNNVTVNFTSGIAWVRTKNLRGPDVQNNHLNQITVNNQPSVYQSNLRLDNYYLNGTVIRGLAASPLTLYDNINLQGSSTALSINIIHSGVSIPDAMNDKAESFVLKKGFMATFAVTDDGTGKSKNYIASEEDLIINELPAYLKNDISFIRVISWNWVTKKGRTGNTSELDNTWYYQWNNTGTSNIDLEYAPMAWGYGGANDDGDIQLYKSKYKATHVMAFNEADNCNDQSGQYSNLCNTDVAVSTYKNLMKTGLRLVSPSCRENAPFGWLKEFHDKANAQDIRIDVIAVHWYDWGSSPAINTDPTPAAVFNRFKTYLQNVHNLYGLPIWITEFNANPNRNNSIQYGFMQLALPYLETLDYVERYCWYQPNALSGSTIKYGDYYEADGTTLTNVGTFYKNQVSTASIPETIVTEYSNLDIYYTTTLNFKVFDLNRYRIYPNPSSGIFTLKGKTPINSYAIHNIHGQLIENATNLMLIEVNINLKNKTKGIYFITIKDRDGNQSSKKLILS